MGNTPRMPWDEPERLAFYGVETAPDTTGRRGDVLTGEQARELRPGAVVRWQRDATTGGLRMHTPTLGWVPPLDSVGPYVVVWPAPDLVRGHEPASRYAGSDGIGNAHCGRCHRYGHVAAHPDLGCADVGCDKTHPDAWTGGPGRVASRTAGGAS